MDAVLTPLRAFATPPRSLVAGSDGVRVADALRRAVPELGGGPNVLQACRVEDLRLKDRQWIGRYIATLAGPDDVPRLMVLTGELRADGAPADRRSVSPTGVGMPFGSRDWRVVLAEPPLTLSTAGEDRKLRALPLITHPANARTWLESSLNDAFPGIHVLACQPEVARYRSGQRCTVICRLEYADGADPSWPEVVVAKVHRKGEGARGHGALQALAAAGLDSARVSFARPLAYEPSIDLSVQSYLPQTSSLTELIERAGAGSEVAIVEAEDALRSVAAGLAALHCTPVDYGPMRVIDDEIASARDRAGRLAAVFSELGGAVEPLLRLIEQRTGDVPADSARPAHGAFRPAQVRLYGERVGLLDLDGFGASEPGQDVGRFAGKLRLMVLRTSPGTDPDQAARLAVADRLAASFLDEYTNESPVSAMRVTLWESLDLVTALLQTWSRARASQIQPILTLLEQQVSALRS